MVTFCLEFLATIPKIKTSTLKINDLNMSNVFVFRGPNLCSRITRRRTTNREFLRVEKKCTEKELSRRYMDTSSLTVVCGRRANWKIEAKTITSVVPPRYVRPSSRADLPRACGPRLYVMDFGRFPMKSFIDPRARLVISPRRVYRLAVKERRLPRFEYPDPLSKANNPAFSASRLH